MRLWRVFFLLLVMPGVLLAGSAESYSIRFGILSEDKGRFSLIKETNEIPNISMSKGLAYGIEVIPVDDLPYVVRMIVYLPDEPKELTGVFSGLNPSSAIDGLEFPEYELQGGSTVPMGLDEGDPLGIYKLEIYINDIFLRVIRFEVKPLESTWNPSFKILGSA